ncbi:class I SAM-dependent methyltransferase [Dyella sp. 2HG41-7]|uniref:class I SAM-dependent methyltransferase n=1 Tax=Dyella sp. 2HG41-7 TaxID=2883239 RepID=UPI001F404402|nr:class I SAM-dependent methyltransferase [Dyella sp. 2HG41-7]
MKTQALLLAALTCTMLAASPVNVAAQDVPAYITAAVADSARPADEKAQDANRKPAEVMAFSGIKPGDKVVDLMPGSGYYTRIFSKIVGPKGVVYALQPTEMDKVVPQRLKAVRSFAGTKDYANVVILVQPIASMQLPKDVDIIWTSQNYHDLHNPMMGSPDMAKVNKAIYNAIKPGGLYVVLDHAAAAGTGASQTNTLHRIDPATVKTEVTAAGFEFAGESDVLRNASDDHKLAIFDKAIKGKTDKFIYKFRKP